MNEHWWPECCGAWIVEHHPSDPYGLFQVRCQCNTGGYWKPGWADSVTLTVPKPKVEVIEEA